MRPLLLALLLTLVAAPALAGTCASYPFTLTNGQTADANQVMANFNSILTCANTSLQPTLVLPLPIVDGGTGATTFPGLVAADNLSDVPNPTTALTNLGGLSKANNLSDVANKTTALTNLLPSQVSQGGNFLTTNGTTTSWAAVQTPITIIDVRNQQTNGTASGETLTASSWNQRTLNATSFNSISGASRGSNQVTLPAGQYEVIASAEAVSPAITGSPATYNHKLRLYDVTDSATLLSGQNAAATLNGTSQIATVTATLNGRFALAASKVVELDSFVNGGSASSGGTAVSSGEIEVYVDLYIRKIG